MPRTADELYQEALQLSEAERGHLADLLEASMDQAAIERAWYEEADRRLDDIDSGRSHLIHWDEVKASLELKLAERKLPERKSPR